MSNTHNKEIVTQQELLDWINEQLIAGEVSDYDRQALEILQQLAEDFFYS